MSDEKSNEASWSVGSVVRREPVPSALVVIALLGLGISVYLTTIHYAHVAPICTVTGIINCANVLKSSFSTIPGTSVPITIPGMLWFLVSGAMAMWALISVGRSQEEPQRLRLYQLLWASGGMLFVLYLVYDEIVQLHNICEWCTAIHILTLLTFILAWYRFTAADRALPAPAPVYREHLHPTRRHSSASAHGYTLPRSARSKGAGGRRPAKVQSRRS